MIYLSAILQNKDNKNVAWNNIMTNICAEIKNISENQTPAKFYQNCIYRTTKLFATMLDLILSVGQLQLLRNLINFHLNSTCKFNSKNLESSLSSLNKYVSKISICLVVLLCMFNFRALVNHIKNEDLPELSENFLSKLSQFFDYAGMNNPLNKIYVTVRTKDEYAVVLFIFVISHLLKVYMFTSGINTKRNLEQWDGAPFITGIHTLIKQFHPNLNNTFIELICNYILQLAQVVG